MKNLMLWVLVLSLVACGSAPDDNKSNKNTDDKTSQVDKKNKDKDGDDKDEEEIIIINVEATTINTGNATSVFRTTTILEADLESEVTSKASGIVLKLNVEVGDNVVEGDILAVLESDIQQLRFQSANANYQKSLNNFERAKVLLTKGLANKESVENLKFETRSLKTNLDQAKLDLDFTKVRAPISGVVTKRYIKKGNLIPLNTQAYEIVDFDSLQAVINVPEDKWNLFKNGLEVNFKFASFDNIIKGTVLRIDPIIDSATGTFKVVMDINKSQELRKNLRPGLFGKTEIILDKRENTLLVSKNAVTREDETAYIYQINEDNSVTKKNIIIGYEMDDDLEILSGIEVGKQVVTTGKNNVSEESTVEVIQYND